MEAGSQTHKEDTVRNVRKAITTLLYMVAVVSLVIALIPLLQYPQPFTFQVSLPKTAEVLPAAQVHPGTFKLELPWSQLTERADATPSKTIISYGGGMLGLTARIEAYLPRGESTFYHAQFERTPNWPAGFQIRRVERNENQFTAYPQIAWTRFAAFLFFGVAVFTAFGLLTDPRTDPWFKRRASAG